MATYREHGASTLEHWRSELCCRKGSVPTDCRPSKMRALDVLEASTTMKKCMAAGINRNERQIDGSRAGGACPSRRSLSPSDDVHHQKCISQTIPATMQLACVERCSRESITTAESLRAVVASTECPGNIALPGQAGQWRMAMDASLVVNTVPRWRAAW